MNPSLFDRLRCLLWHSPAHAAKSPCRCLSCGAMIEWDDKGGWRYA